MKKLLSLIAVLSIIAAVTIGAGAATIGSGKWNALDSSRWELDSDGFLVMKSGGITMMGFNDSVGDHTGYTLYSDSYEMEFDIKLGGVFVVVFNCRFISAYGGTRLAFDMTNGVSGGDYDYAAAAGSAFAGTDPLAGFDSSKEYQTIKIKKENGKISVWVNGTANISAQAVTFCDSEGLITLAYEGSAASTMKNFRFTSGSEVITDFTEETAVSSVPTDTSSDAASDTSSDSSSEASSSASTGSESSNPNTSDSSAVYMVLTLIAVICGVTVLAGKKRFN